MVNNQAIILFDGVCNLCNSSVQFVISNDKKKLFQFASLQSNSGKALLEKYGLNSNDLNSFVLIQNNKAYNRSTAALNVAGQLSGAVKLLAVFKIVPPYIRDIVYKFIAKNRYKWFGQREACMIPTPELKSRFLND
ncbi:MAG: thiol-disulfide oxidoreductase DCC family protein [Ferruginibacter sp.]